MDRVPAILAAVSLVLAAPAAGLASDGGRDAGGGDEARTRTACFGGAAELRLRSDERDDQRAAKIDVELRLDARNRSRGVQTWRVVLLHERTIVYQGARRSTGPSYSLRLRLNVPDWPGRETVTARIANGNARTCVVETTI